MYTSLLKKIDSERTLAEKLTDDKYPPALSAEYLAEKLRQGVSYYNSNRSYNSYRSLTSLSSMERSTSSTPTQSEGRPNSSNSSAFVYSVHNSESPSFFITNTRTALEQSTDDKYDTISEEKLNRECLATLAISSPIVETVVASSSLDEDDETDQSLTI